MLSTSPGASARHIHRLARLLAVLLCLGLPALLASRPAYAASFTVDTATDEADGFCANDPAPPLDCSLRDAIAAAAATADGADVITFAPAVTTVTLSNALGTLAISQDLTITGDAGSRTQIVAPTGARAFTVTAGTVTLENLFINGGSFPNVGAGIDNATNTTNGLTLNNLRISNSAGSGAGSGGAIVNSGKLTVNGSTFDVHGATTGGTIYNTGNATINNSSLSGSSAQTAGAIYNSGTLTVTGSVIYGNSTSSGAGGAFLNDATGTATFTNTTFSGNTAGGPDGAPRNGGAIAVNSGTVSLNSVTVAGNTAQDAGGGIYGNVTMKATLVAGNTAPDAGPDVSGTVTSQGYNLIGNASGATITGTTTGNVTGDNARIAALGAYGVTNGLLTHALLPGSPAIDAVPAAQCPANDQRGIVRAATSGAGSAGTPCDIGAFESRGFTVSVTSGSGQSAQTNTPFGTTIVLQLASANGEPVGSGGLSWTGPASGASVVPRTGTVPALTDGSVEINFFNANGIAGGPYNVSFTARGIETPATVSLTNTAAPTPVYASNPTPGAVNVGTATVGQQVSTSITVSENGNAPLIVTSAVLSGANAAEFGVSPTSFTIADGGAAQPVSVTCTPAAAGARTATLTITHNAAGSPAVYSLTCTGVVTAVPGYSSTPAPGGTLAIGPVALTDTKSTTLTISETGSATLNITSVAISGADAADFSVTPTTLSIANGGAAQALTVSCTPSQLATRTATLTVTHNASGSPAVYTLTCSTEGLFLPLIGR